MTSSYHRKAQLSRRTTSLSNPSSDVTDDATMPSDFDEVAPRHGRQMFISDKEGAVPPKPLIDYITNEWQTNPKYKEDHEFRPPGRAEAYPESGLDEFLDRMEDFYDALIDLIKSARFRRNVFYFVTAIAGSLWTWYYVLVPHMQETQAALATFDEIDLSNGLYGHNKRPSFPEMIQLRTLDPGLLPTDGTSRLRRPRSRRLVFVGDIHGCKDELVMLLDKVSSMERILMLHKQILPDSVPSSTYFANILFSRRSSTPNMTTSSLLGT